MSRRMLIFLFLCSTLFFSPSITVAEKQTTRDGKVNEWFLEESNSEEHERMQEPTETIGIEDESLAFPLIKMVFVLAFIIGLIYFLAKFVNKRTSAFSGNEAIEMVSGISLGNHRSIQLVKIGDRILVLGVAESIQILQEITDEREIERLVANHESTSTYDDMFTKVKKWFQTRKLDKQSPDITTFDEQLKQMVAKRKSIYTTAEEKERNDE